RAAPARRRSPRRRAPGPNPDPPAGPRSTSSRDPPAHSRNPTPSATPPNLADVKRPMSYTVPCCSASWVSTWPTQGANLQPGGGQPTPVCQYGRRAQPCSGEVAAKALAEGGVALMVVLDGASLTIESLAAVAEGR